MSMYILSTAGYRFFLVLLVKPLIQRSNKILPPEIFAIGLILLYLHLYLRKYRIEIKKRFSIVQSFFNIHYTPFVLFANDPFKQEELQVN